MDGFADEMTAEQRAQRAWQACALYDESVSDPETTAIDLLADLMHLAEARGSTSGERESG